ncbi:transcription termination/antitermination protein NusA [bacterium CG_4_9_14_3_um_filter_65_15]|nr:MAG: transcription termination/antitermination protein NusA [bacterium CG_4_9_14_3_um_filter_65_15]
MDHNVMNALSQITREKNIDKAVIIESLEAGLQSAARKKLGTEANIDARVDPETGEMVVEQVKTVVEEVDDPDTDIDLEEARIEFGDEVEIGDEVRWELPLEEFGRNAILVAKQILVQKVREAERAQIFEEYKDRVNEIIVGTVQQVDRGNVLVNLGRTEALMPYREQIRGEKLHQGKTVRAFITEVLDSAKGPQVILSRSHPGFLKALFHQEVPEIQENIVEIKAVAREPGTRSKIAVLSNDDRVDPVGSCVGMKGSRVQAVTRELAGERVDIVPWSAEPSLLIGRALSPAIVNNIILNRDAKEATVVVNEDQLSKAIGKEGKNVRLAAKLTEWKIDLVSTREYNTRQRVTNEMSMKLGEMEGVTDELLVLLEAVGILSIEDLARANPERLEGIEGMDAEQAEGLRATAAVTLNELNRMIENAVGEELAQQAEEELPLFDESAMDEPVAEEDVELTEHNVEAPEEGELFKDLPTEDAEAEPEAADEAAAEEIEDSEESDESDEPKEPEA